MDGSGATRVVLLTHNRLMAEGVSSVFGKSGDFSVTALCDSASAVAGCLATQETDIVLVDCALADNIAVLHEVCSSVRHCQVMLWGNSVSPEFASQAIELGVRGIIPSDAAVPVFLEALKVVQSGQLWFTKHLMESVLLATRHQLTRREGEVIALISQGLKNKQIAHALGIGEGTVKVYLSRIFKKVGVDDRFQLALFAVRNVLNSRGATLGPARDSGVSEPAGYGSQGLHSLVMPPAHYSFEDPILSPRIAFRPITGHSI